MTLTIELPLQLERRLKEEAARSGEAAETYVVRLIEDRLGSLRADDPAWRARIEEIVARARASVSASGISDEDLETEIDRACEEVRSERYEARRAGRRSSG